MPTLSLQGNSSSSYKGSLEKSYLFLYVGAEIFDYWLDFSVASSMLDSTDSFSFQAPVHPGVNDEKTLTNRGLVEGAVVSVWGRAPNGKTLQQHIGRCDEITYEVTRDGGTLLSVTGRDHMGPLVDSDAMPSIAMRGTTFREVILKAIEGYGFSAKQVLIDNDANRDILTGRPVSGTKMSVDAPTNLAELNIDQARPHAGETIHAFLTRHCKRFGLLMWGTAKGEIVFGRPNYSQKPIYQINLNKFKNTSTNNVKAIRRHKNVKHVPSEVHVFGKSHGHDWYRSNVHAVVTDAYTKNMGFKRVLTVSDHNCRNSSEAEQRAKYELSHKRQSADVVNATMYGISQNEYVYAVDTVADINSDAIGINNEAWYIIGRRFTASRSAGTQTHLHLVPKGSIALGQVPFSDRKD